MWLELISLEHEYTCFVISFVGQFCFTVFFHFALFHMIVLAFSRFVSFHISFYHPGLTSQRHSALISSDSEYFQVCFSAVHCLKISEQRWFSSEQRWKRKFSELKISGVFSVSSPPADYFPPSRSCSCRYQCIHWIRLLRVSRLCTQYTNLKYPPRSWVLAEAS